MHGKPCHTVLLLVIAAALLVGCRQATPQTIVNTVEVTRVAEEEAQPIIETLVVTATPSNTPLPTETPTYTVTPEPSATPTSTATATPRPTDTPRPTKTPTPVPTFTLSGVVFFDYNGNGVRDEHEPPIQDATVQVGSLTAVSAPDGAYSLEGVPQGRRAVKVSAEGFRYISLSVKAFQSCDSAVSVTVDSDTRRDWGLMQGFLTLPFLRDTPINFIIHVDVDPGPTFRDWRGSDGSDYVKERDVLNGHLGTDFAVSGNPPVVAAAPGVVLEAEDGWPNNPRAEDPDTGLRDDGNRVVIDHGSGLLTIYCHLDSVSTVVGQAVERGEIIGFSGRSGCFAPGQPGHLHFQFGGFGQARIDPYRDVLDSRSLN